MNGLVNWLDERFPLVSTWKAHFSNYYAPKNFNFLYFFGSLALIVLVNQIITGLWLTMFYTPNAEQAFSSVEFIMRDVNFGWLLRYMHSTGASAFFMLSICICLEVCFMVLIRNHGSWFGYWGCSYISC